MVKFKISLATWLLFCVVISTCIPQPIYCQEKSDNTSLNSQKKLRPLFVSLGTLIETFSILSDYSIPYLGAGHFLQKDWLKGSLYLGGEVSLFLIGDKFLDRVGPRDYQLYPDLSNDAVYFRREGLSPSANKYDKYYFITEHSFFYLRMIDFFSSYRSIHSKTSETNKVQIDRRSIPSLMLSPFKPRYLKNPWVFVPIILSGIGGYLLSDSDRPISKASSITMFDKQYTPFQATLLTAGIGAYVYALTAMGEEMFCRGVIQTELTEHMSPGLAIPLSSLLFGLWHIPNKGLGGGLVATVAGLYLGYRYHKSGYDLGEVIASHFWWNWLHTVIEFIRNPKEGRFVYSISWKF